MKVRSVKTNYLLNVVRSASYVLITLIAMPYINKTLGPANVGKVAYVQTIINYFVLFSALGIPMYGIREISKFRHDKKASDKTAVELMVILSVTTIISYFILFGILYQLHFFAHYRDLILMMSLIIVLSNMSAEWYFQGMEDQLYITIRYVGVRIISLILLFLLVQSKDDYLMYALTIVITTGGSAISNIYYLFQNIDFSSVLWSQLHLKRHLKPIFTIFIAAVSVTIYLQFDHFLISAMAGDDYLGYYSVSNQLIRFIITFITVVGMVMLPRLSHLYPTDKVLYQQYLKKAFLLIMMMAIPSSITFLFFSNFIISLLAGSEFLPSVLTMQLLSPLCIIVGFAYFIGYLLLYTQNKDSVYTKAVVISAIFSIVINVFAIHYYQQNGAAVVAVLAELLAILIMMHLAKKELKELNIVNRNFYKILLVSLIVFLVSGGLSFIVSTDSVLLKIFIMLIPYFIFYPMLLLVKEELSSELLLVGMAKIKKYRS